MYQYTFSCGAELDFLLFIIHVQALTLSNLRVCT